MTLTGANVAFGKAVVAEFPIYVFVLFRFVVASAALLLIVGTEGGPKLREMMPGQRRDLFLMSLLGMVGFTVLMFEGLKRTAAADAGIVTATLPAVVALLGVIVIGDRLSRMQTAAVALAVAGLVLVHTTGAATGTSTLLGNLLVGGAVLCEASFVLLGKRLAPPYRPLRLALGANLVGLALPCRWHSWNCRPSIRRRCGRRCGCSAFGIACRQRDLPVAVVSRPALCRDLARGARDRRHPGGRARHVRTLPGRNDRPGQTRRGCVGDCRYRARIAGITPPVAALGCRSRALRG